MGGKRRGGVSREDRLGGEEQYGPSGNTDPEGRDRRMEDIGLEKGVRAGWPPEPYSSKAGIQEVTLSYFVAENRE